MLEISPNTDGAESRPVVDRTRGWIGSAEPVPPSVMQITRRIRTILQTRITE